MRSLSKFPIDQSNKAAVDAQLRMATLPFGPDVEYYFVHSDLWVPIVAIHSKIHILPGVPQLFKRLLTGLEPRIVERVPADQQRQRYFISTKLRESELAPYLTKLQNEVKGRNVKIGSYPHMSTGNVTISVIGKKSDDVLLQEIAKDVEDNLKGTRLTKEQEEQNSKHSL